MGDAKFGCPHHRAAHRFGAALVADRTRQATRLRPPPVAVHDDGDMERRARAGR